MTKAANEQRRTLWIELRPEQYDAQRKRAEEIVARDNRTKAIYVRDDNGHVIFLKNTTCDGGPFRASGAQVEVVAHEHVQHAEAGITIRSLQAQIAELSGRNGDGDHYALVRSALAAYAFELNHVEPPQRFDTVRDIASYVESLTFAVMEGKECVGTEKKRDDLDARVAELEAELSKREQAYQDKRTYYERQIAELKTQVEGMEDTLGRVENDKRDAEGRYHKIAQASIELDAKKRALEAQVARYKGQGIPNASETARLSSDIRALAEKVGASKRENELLRSQAAGYEKMRSELEGEAKRWKEEHAKAEKRAHELEESLGVYERSVDAPDERLIPDPEAETTAELFGYLFGRGGKDKAVVEHIFGGCDIRSHRRTGRGGATRIYRFGAFDNGSLQLVTIVTAVHKEFGIIEQSVEESVAFVRNYFAAGGQNGYNPAHWKDSRTVTLREAALGARKAETTLMAAFRGNAITPVSEKWEKKYLVGAIKHILAETSLRRPKPVYKTT